MKDLMRPSLAAPAIETRIRSLAQLFNALVLSLALGIPGSPLFVSPWWLALTAFVGVNLQQSWFTRWCPMKIIMPRLGLRTGS